MKKKLTMSEQETSRSVGSSSTSKTQGGNQEDTSNRDTTQGVAQTDTSKGVPVESISQREPQTDINEGNKNKGNTNLEIVKSSTRQEDISQRAPAKKPTEETSKESTGITQNLPQNTSHELAEINITVIDAKPSESDAIHSDTKLSVVDTSQKDLSQEDNIQKDLSQEDNIQKDKLSEGDTNQKVISLTEEDNKLSKVETIQKGTSATVSEADTCQEDTRPKDTSQSIHEDSSLGVKQESLLRDTRQEGRESSISQGALHSDTGQEGIQRNINLITDQGNTSSQGASKENKQGNIIQESTSLGVLQVDANLKGDRQGNSVESSTHSQCGPILSTCVSSDSGMGNTIFSSPGKSDNGDGNLKNEKEVSGCDYLKLGSGEGLSRNKETISSTRETIHSDDKLSVSSVDSATFDGGLKSSAILFKKSGDKEVQENLSHIGKNRTEDCPSSSVDEGIDLHDSSDALENSGDEDNENVFEKAKICDELCGGDDSGVSADGKKGETESSYKSSNSSEAKLRVADIHETQESEILERMEGVGMLPKCIDKQELKSDLSKETSSELSQHISQSVARSNLHTEDTSSLVADYSSVGGCNLAVVSRNITENGNPGVEGCNMNAQGCTVDMLACNVDPDCYTPGDNLMCTDHPIRDTDSEAGDSCCSEDHDHGEACHGENGCVHGVDGDALDQNWDYVVDEEFNVPRRPIFNGSADELERRSSLKRKASEEPEESKPAKCKRGIQFEGVTVFYFPRSQGFTCVPSQGGSSLGMSRRHSHIRQFSLAEHAVEQRRAHREYLMRLRQQRSARERGESSSRGSSSEDSEENSEEASDLSDSELDADSYYFLQPLPIRQRRALLRQAGICHIEGLEKEECKDIRISREMCGCQCKVYCDPDTCQCAQAGIKCQVDRHNFPCGCSREGCGNSFGRIEFNPIRVRTHFIHTLMRLEIEKRQTQQQQQQHQQQQQQQQEWQQQQQRAKWLASSSAPANGFSGGSGLGGNNLPFFEGGRDSGGLPVTDANKFNSSVEMGACVGSMNAPLYPHFESRQMLTPGGPSVYIQHDSVGDYNSGTCSVFGGLGATFDPSGAYGSCHGFPSASVVAPPPQVGPQVAPSQPTPPEAYNTLSKFANTTTSLVSSSFPYSGGVSPAATAAVPTVNCSYPQNNFCMTAVHDNTNGTVFGQYHDPSAVTQNLFKATVNECSDFQPNFEALSSASADKAGRYIPAPSLVGQSKEMCGGEYTTETAVSTQSQCPGIIEDSYKVTEGDSSSCSSSHHTSNSTPELHPSQLPTSSAPPPPLSYDHGTPGKDASSTEDPTEAAENLGEIVKKSMVETVSA